ncbi:MAG: LysR family transcriptional regulator [Chromatiales bacterium]|jgi:DNA-binding transcriptional LysR family regulator
MDIDQIRTFLAVAGSGSFLEAAARLHVSQSTVSARIRGLEAGLGARLFVRNRSGASLTLSGRRFLRHAKTVMLSLEQARQDVGLPRRFQGSITVGARIALWEGLLPRWVGAVRSELPDVLVRSEIGFEEDLMRRLVEGTLDLGLMYTPQYSPGLRVEHLFDETLVLVSTDPDTPWPDPGYVYIDWGPAFHAEHTNHYPDLEHPSQVANIGWLGIQLILANGGSCFLPVRMVRNLMDRGRLHPVPTGPPFSLPAYMVYAREDRSAALERALVLLRDLGAGETAGAEGPRG